MKTYKVPVEWAVYDFVEVEAESFEDAIQYVIDNRDEIPLGTEPEYIDGTYKINSEDETSLTEYDDGYAKELADMLRTYGYGD